MQINSRREYNLDSLDFEDLPDSPMEAVEYWLAAANKQPDYNAFHLSTSNGDGRVSGRMVLLKGIEQGRLMFFTDYDSRKGQQINKNNRVAATFFWPALERQIRIEGTATRLSAGQSDAYFDSRPPESRAAAIASLQSQKAESRADLEQRYETMLKGNEQLERPARWGGYGIEPFYVEFWQGRPSRLNDRIVFEKSEGKWIRYRLEP
ncbi:Pyridoxine/pyridoxamine 5'-phosphate oxidase [Salinivirga cyanobacteriivorans]|uniref:Pyridoxamine 5'-phosphate oxidase n=1 Tax=Salinivirga cyanobacteriivorans TaxID=1307839 RepID=A0A0S2I5H7_9BACT|nr:pyridoxamine 5'-phosphate oxidase [Salinivirga cyanobacteriivorans]ALO17419.1 Pyridoxine/pyridoxamine 5'-phosphate oxidase [Salinivirga cyanobacteriivorans]